MSEKKNKVKKTLLQIKKSIRWNENQNNIKQEH